MTAVETESLRPRAQPVSIYRTTKGRAIPQCNAPSFGPPTMITALVRLMSCLRVEPSPVHIMQISPFIDVFL